MSDIEATCDTLSDAVDIIIWDRIKDIFFFVASLVYHVYRLLSLVPSVPKCVLRKEWLVKQTNKQIHTASIGYFETRDFKMTS